MLFCKRRFILPLIILFFFILSGCGMTEKAITVRMAPDSIDKGSLLQVRFLNVGQADSILVIAPNGQTILVDGGCKM